MLILREQNNIKMSTLLTGAASTIMTNVTHTPKSSFETGAIKLGFETIEKQNALLSILVIAGYLQPKKAWEDFYRAHLVEDDIAEEFFKQNIFSAIWHSKADQGVEEFDVNILRQELLGRCFNKADNWLLYVTQNALGRKHGQEVTDLKAQDWMEAFKDLYIENAKVLQLIDSLPPLYEKYDFGWIAGTSRDDFIGRTIYYKSTVLEKVQKKTKVLSGARELWAEIDGISQEFKSKLKNIKGVADIIAFIANKSQEEAIEEGKEYIQYVANEYNIELKNPPVIKYSTHEECPAGRGIDRFYPNYEDSTGCRITESLMCKDILKVIFQERVDVIDTASLGGMRPNTQASSKDAASELVEEIKSGKYGEQKEFRIAFQSNQPFVPRQTLVTQIEIDKALKRAGLENYSIILDGIGFESYEGVCLIHSELSALIAEMWKAVHPREENLFKSLSFQGRNNYEPVPVIEFIRDIP